MRFPPQRLSRGPRAPPRVLRRAGLLPAADRLERRHQLSGADRLVGETTIVSELLLRALDFRGRPRASSSAVSHVRPFGCRQLQRLSDVSSAARRCSSRWSPRRSFSSCSVSAYIFGESLINRARIVWARVRVALSSPAASARSSAARYAYFLARELLFIPCKCAAARSSSSASRGCSFLNAAADAYPPLGRGSCPRAVALLLPSSYLQVFLR